MSVMKDEMIRGTAFGDQIRFFAAYTKDTVEEARQIHDLSPLCTAALGRLLTAGLMMGAMGKNLQEFGYTVKYFNQLIIEMKK